jgi:hypothetical protein
MMIQRLGSPKPLPGHRPVLSPGCCPTVAGRIFIFSRSLLDRQQKRLPCQQLQQKLERPKISHDQKKYGLPYSNFADKLFMCSVFVVSGLKCGRTQAGPAKSQAG